MKIQSIGLVFAILTTNCVLNAETAMNDSKKLPGYDTRYGVSADSIKDFTTDLKMPTPQGMKVRKLNHKGFMRLETDVISAEFIKFAAKSNGIALDVGCSYGFIPLEVLQAGGKIIANDTDPRHLLILNKAVAPENRKNLIFNTDNFPNNMDFPKGSINAVSLNRVLHFLTPDELKIAFAKLNNWLPKGGRVFITAMSPYHPILHFEEEYAKRIAEGVQWPGVITDMKTRLPDIKDDIPDYLHTLSTEVLSEQLEANGFKVIEERYFDFASSASPRERAYAGIIAEKI